MLYGLWLSQTLLNRAKRLLWNTQFHNENYVIPGVFLVLYGWIGVITMNEKNVFGKRFDLVLNLSSIAVGSFLIGLVRETTISSIFLLFVMIGLSFSIYWFIKRKKNWNLIFSIVTVFVSCAIMWTTIKVIGSSRNRVLGVIEREIVSITNSNSDSINSDPAVIETPSNDRNSQKWRNTDWLPSVIDKQLKNLALYRKSLVKAWRDSGSAIDTDIIFNDAGELLSYIPRALQIGVLSPFPNTWFTTGKKITGEAMRAVSAFEMMFVYISLIGLPVFLWNYRKNPTVWIIFFVCISMILVYTMIVPNVGALYRFRYPYLMPLVSLGLIGWISQNYGIITLWKKHT